jgi:hypothetical protein
LTLTIVIKIVFLPTICPQNGLSSAIFTENQPKNHLDSDKLAPGAMQNAQ